MKWLFFTSRGNRFLGKPRIAAFLRRLKPEGHCQNGRFRSRDLSLKKLNFDAGFFSLFWTLGCRSNSCTSANLGTLIISQENMEAFRYFNIYSMGEILTCVTACFAAVAIITYSNGLIITNKIWLYITFNLSQLKYIYFGFDISDLVK